MRVEPLSPEDATIWCAQAADAPLQLGGMALCQGETLRDESGAIPIDRIRRHLEARLTRAPRFRQVLRRVPFGQGLVWVDDPHFDIARHLRLAALPRPGTDAQLREFVARLMEAPFPADRPLWEFWVVEGVAGDRVALVPKVSHVIGDGMAILGVVFSMFDPEPRIQEDPPGPWFASSPPAALPMLATVAYQRWRRQAEAVWHLGRSLASPTEVPGRVAAVVRAGRTLLAPAPALPFTRPVGPRRDFAWVRLELPDLERVKVLMGVKLNDVVLAVVMAAVAGYVEQATIHADGVAAPLPGRVFAVAWSGPSTVSGPPRPPIVGRRGGKGTDPTQGRNLDHDPPPDQAPRRTDGPCDRGFDAGGSCGRPGIMRPRIQPWGFAT